MSLYYNGTDSCLFVSATEMHRFKAKDSKILGYSLRLGNISKDWLVDDMKKTGLKGYVYDFSTAYNYIPVSDILDIDKYLMEKNGIVVQKCSRLLSKYLFQH